MIAEREVNGLVLTEQMNRAIDLVLSGVDVKFFAYAGSRKSTLLRAIEKYIGEKRDYTFALTNFLRKKLGLFSTVQT